MVRFRKRRQLKGKAYEKHSDTLISVIGPGTTTSTRMIVRDTEQGARTPAGNTDTIQLGRGNNEECNQGDICKFINLTLQAGPRDTADATAIGWIEWAFYLGKEVDPKPTIANKGTNTLGDIVTKYMRNQCLMTGAMPIGQAQCAVTLISLKIPDKWQRLTTGDQWNFVYWARTISSTETATDTFKVIASFNYKNYH